MKAASPVLTSGKDDGFIVLLCPFCETQVTNDLRKPRKRILCLSCKSRFIAVTPEFAFDCAHCGTWLQIPRWIVGKNVRCPDCRGELKLRWEDDAEGHTA